MLPLAHFEDIHLTLARYWIEAFGAFAIISGSMLSPVTYFLDFVTYLHHTSGSKSVFKIVFERIDLSGIAWKSMAS